MDQLPQTRLLKASSFYSSAPLGPADQPRYTNAVALLETRLEPLQLLEQLQAIEQQHGRTRLGERWEDRKSTRLNSSHVRISYAVFCLKKKRISSISDIRN